ncbi:hypothetical protein M758_3G011400 [Ceratodon purpureus]|nr:hypothetical protein M758_3G011400 [Ceratodon purpureus]
MWTPNSFKSPPRYNHNNRTLPACHTLTPPPHSLKIQIVHLCETSSVYLGKVPSDDATRSGVTMLRMSRLRMHACECFHRE